METVGTLERVTVPLEMAGAEDKVIVPLEIATALDSAKGGALESATTFRLLKLTATMLDGVTAKTLDGVTDTTLDGVTPMADATLMVNGKVLVWTVRTLTPAGLLDAAVIIASIVETVLTDEKASKIETAVLLAIRVSAAVCIQSWTAARNPAMRWS